MKSSQLNPSVSPQFHTFISNHILSTHLCFGLPSRVFNTNTTNTSYVSLLLNTLCPRDTCPHHCRLLFVISTPIFSPAKPPCFSCVLLGGYHGFSTTSSMGSDVKVENKRIVSPKALLQIQHL